MRKIYHSFSTISLSLIILVSILLTQNAEAKNSIYHNSENHFSFRIPDGWMEVPQNVLDEYIKLLEQQANEANVPLSEAAIPIAGFQLKKSNEWLYSKLPSFRAGINRVGKVSESEIKKLIASGEYKEACDESISEAKRILPIIKNLKINEPIYDDKQKLILTKGSLFATEIRKRMFLIAMFLSNEGTINLAFNSSEDDFQKYMLDFSEVINSFKFDPGYEYK